MGRTVLTFVARRYAYIFDWLNKVKYRIKNLIQNLACWEGTPNSIKIHPFIRNSFLNLYFCTFIFNT